MKTIKIFITSFCILYLSDAYSQWSGTTQVYLNPGQSAGIGTQSPQAPLHIIGDGLANAQGWNKAIILDKNAALYWKGSQNSYFMAHPSGTPAGDFYQGFSAGINPSAVVTYTSKVFASIAPPAGVPQGSTQFYQNLIVLDFNNAIKRSIGVNILVPKRNVDIVNNGNTAADAQLRPTYFYRYAGAYY